VGVFVLSPTPTKPYHHPNGLAGMYVHVLPVGRRSVQDAAPRWGDAPLMGGIAPMGSARGRSTLALPFCAGCLEMFGFAEHF
jgi:hypothetical protein